MKLEQINIYRITHIDNIPHILKHGITHKTSAYFDLRYKAIGDSSLIDTRSNKVAYITNNDDGIIESVTLGDYIPFYFGAKMPMLYVIQHGGNFVPEATAPKNIIYVVCSIKRILDSGVKFIFTDGHATDKLTTFYNEEKINDLCDIIDWRAVKKSYWGGEENLDVKRKKQAEFLVKGDVLNSCIIGYGCYNRDAMKKLIEYGVETDLIKIIPGAYY